MQAGTVFKGTVTQTGAVTDGGYCYEALQTCTLTVVSVRGEAVVCDVGRVESEKFIDGESGWRLSLPDYLNSYLTTWGSCVERAIGTYDPFTGFLLLKGQRLKVVRESEVQWSHHYYALVVDGSRVTGPVFCLEKMEDRDSGVGALVVELVAE